MAIEISAVTQVEFFARHWHQHNSYRNSFCVVTHTRCSSSLQYTSHWQESRVCLILFNIISGKHFSLSQDSSGESVLPPTWDICPTTTLSNMSGSLRLPGVGDLQGSVVGLCPTENTLVASGTELCPPFPPPSTLMKDTPSARNHFLTPMEHSPCPGAIPLHLGSVNDPTPVGLWQWQGQRLCLGCHLPSQPHPASCWGGIWVVWWLKANADVAAGLAGRCGYTFEPCRALPRNHHGTCWASVVDFLPWGTLPHAVFERERLHRSDMRDFAPNKGMFQGIPCSKKSLDLKGFFTSELLFYLLNSLLENLQCYIQQMHATAFT